MKILVTGCCGYIGSLLTQYLLEQNHTVIGVDVLLYGNYEPLLNLLGRPNFKFIKTNAVEVGGLLKEFRPDVIIPLAAFVGAPSVKNILKMLVKLM